MGKINCEIHGENVIALISEYHHERMGIGKKCKLSEVKTIIVDDKEGLFNGHYQVDPYLIREIGIQNSRIDVQSDFKKYELMFNKLSPVCPMCLKEYLSKI
ncbi:hypothetical protein AB9K26_00630 [Psychroserpens sp. XS_ASV72]|uniref:hypothetical protein n=1 Tax=Psychroserpens sp. XS_ASV72 TaxID=3241293 RepID=UPI003511C4C5